MCYNIHLQIDSHCPEMRALGGLLEAACKTPYNQQEFMMSKISQLSGKRFGRLVAIERDMSTQYKYICKCDCGTIKSIDGYHLINGKIRSCGCLKRDTTIARSTKHGKARSPLYTKWQDMKRRCYNQNRREYKHYGARGITVCDEWRNDFEAFEKWCLENGYDGKLSLDRIDNDGNYEPDNCRFVIYDIQSQNSRRKANKNGYRGVTLIKKRFCAYIGLNGKKKFIGSAKTAKEAAMIRDTYIDNHNLQHIKSIQTNNKGML